MVNEYLVEQTKKMFTTIAIKLINPRFKFPQGGASTRLLTNALSKLERKENGLSRQRIVDYVVCSAYPFKEREGAWTINQVFGPKSLERFNTDKGRRYYEDQWLKTANLTRASLLKMIEDKSEHPQAKYIYMPMEEPTKKRMLNTSVGYAICQASTLGWSPESEACRECDYTHKCQIETQRKFPEIYRLRVENGVK